MPFPSRNAALCHRAGLLALLLVAPLVSGCDSPEEKAETYYSRAMATLDAGDYEKAAIDFRNALKLKEDFTDAQVGLARVEERRRNFAAAAAIYEAVAQRQPRHLESRIRLAQYLLASGQAEAAAKPTEQAFALAPKDPRVLSVKAGIALSRNDAGGAVRLANEALRIDSGNTTALMVLASERIAAADPSGALGILDRGLRENDAQLDLQLLKLRTLDSIGDRKDVEKLLVRLSQIVPDDPALHDTLIKWYLQQDRAGDAERAARQFAFANRADASAQIRLAMLLKQTRGAAAATEELAAIIPRFPQDDAAGLAALKAAGAQLRLAAGQSEAAIAELEELISTSEDGAICVKAQVQLAQTFASLAQWDQASAMSDRVLASDPRNVDALTARATARMAKGNAAAAVEDLTTAASEAPGSAAIARLLAEGQEQLGASALAQTHYEKAFVLSGYAPANGVKLAQFLLRYGKSQEAARVLEDLRSSGTADRASLGLLAQIRLGARDWKGAEELAGIMRSMSPAGEDALAEQISAAALAGQSSKGERIEILEARFAQSPDAPWIQEALVKAYLGGGKPEQAEAMVRKQLQTHPGDVRLQIMLGSVLVATGRSGEAEAVFREAAHGETGAARAHLVLAQFYLRSGRAEAAEGVAREGLKREDSSALRLLLAEILEARGAFSRAIAEYEHLLETDPQSTVVANNLASLLSEHGTDPKSLERAYTIAIRFRNSDVPQFLDTLGWIHYLRGETGAALPLLKAAAERLPKSGTVQYHYGMALKAAGQPKLSAVALGEAMRLAPGPDTPYLKAVTAALAQVQPAPSTN